MMKLRHVLLVTSVLGPACDAPAPPIHRDDSHEQQRRQLRPGKANLASITWTSASNSWTAPPGVYWILLQGCGSGGSGAGGGSGSTGATVAACGGGGGSGAPLVTQTVAVVPNTAYTITIGAAATGGALGTNGADGNDSTFGSLATFKGGGMGFANANTSGGELLAFGGASKGAVSNAPSGAPTYVTPIGPSWGGAGTNGFTFFGTTNSQAGAPALTGGAGGLSAAHGSTSTNLGGGAGGGGGGGGSLVAGGAAGGAGGAGGNGQNASAGLGGTVGQSPGANTCAGGGGGGAGGNGNSSGGAGAAGGASGSGWMQGYWFE